VITASYSGLGATSNPCDAIANATTREACKMALAAKGPNAIAQFLAAKGGEAACNAAGAGAIASLCGKAAQAVYNWVVGGYSAAERADILYRAANGQAGAVAQMGVYGSFGPLPGAAQITPVRDAVRTNIKLLGVGEAWARVKAEGVDLILLGMILKGVAGKTIGWWKTKRSAGDLSPLPAASGASVVGPIKPPASGAPPPGAITAWSAKRNVWRVAVPRGMRGFGETTDRPFYKNPWFWITTGAVAGTAIGGYFILRKR
jgi:hypothetical protein